MSISDSGVHTGLLEGSPLPGRERAALALNLSFEARPAGRGTTIRVEMEYIPPAGAVGAAFALLFNAAPEQHIYDALKRLKQVIETGEVLRSDGSLQGAGRSTQGPA